MKKIIIIGGGISGLIAGIYAQKAGYETVIYERNAVPGGECTGWERQGFHIDGCIHWLTGTQKGSGLYEIWKESGGLEEGEIYRPEYYIKGQYEGTEVTLFRDLEKLKQHLLEIAPEDEKEIKHLCKYINIFATEKSFDYLAHKPMDLMGFFDKIKFYMAMMKSGMVINKLGKITLGEYLQRFSNPAVRITLGSFLPESFCAYVLHTTLGTFVSDNGDQPQGGSRAFALRIAEKYRELGGKIKLNSEVDKIIVEDNTARGVILSKNNKNEKVKDLADYIIPACDTDITFQKLLDGKYNDPEFTKRYQDQEKYPLTSSVLVALGVEADLSAYPECLVFQTEEFSFEDTQKDIISYKHYCHEPSFAPEGKSVLNVTFKADCDWWQQFARDKKAYNKEKQRLGREVVTRMENKYPELAGKIKIIDVATPLTFERYCGAYKGSWMSFGITPDGEQLRHDGQLEGLDNLFLAGQWLMSPGGLPVAALTGKWVVQRINEQEGK